MQAKLRRDPLLAAICHDLRAPLASVTMGTSFVLQTTPNDEANARSRRILEAMLRSCARMDRLVRNFADFSEIEDGALDLRTGKHDAREVGEIAAGAARARAAERGVAIEVGAPEAPLVVECDRERVLRAIGHLVDNAVAHAPDGSVVTVALAAEGDHVAFRVTDRGPGPSEEARRHLFERHGKSLGLAIVRGFAEAHGGSIALEPRREETTTFALRIPRELGVTPRHAG